MLSKILKFEFFASICGFPPSSTFPQWDLAETIPYEIIAIFAQSLVSETLFTTVVYGEVPMYIIMHNL